MVVNYCTKIMTCTQYSYIINTDFAGLKPIESITELRKAHAERNIGASIDVKKGCIYLRRMSCEYTYFVVCT